MSYEVPERAVDVGEKVGVGDGVGRGDCACRRGLQ